MDLNYWKQIDIQGNMFDFQSQYERFAEEMPDRAIIAEVGVSNGKSALFLASKLIEKGKEYQLEMIDNMAYGGSVQMQEVLKNIIASGLPNINLVPKDSLNASTCYPDELFDLVFLDSSHEYEQTKAELRCWIHKIKDGGVLGGHDAHCEAVKKAITEVIPQDMLHIEETDHKWGVWWIRKTNKMLL